MQKTPILLFYKFLQKRVFFAGTYKMVFGSIRKPIWPYGRFLGQLKTSTRYPKFCLHVTNVALLLYKK